MHKEALFLMQASWRSSPDCKAFVKGLVYPKMKIMSLFTHPDVVPTRKPFIYRRNTN